MRTYVLHIVPERAPSVSRTVELLATQTFRDLHLAIQRHFSLDNDHMYAFFMSGNAWDRSGIFCDGNPRISLQQGGCKAGKEFLYLFDFGDELRHSIRVESEGTKQEGVSYPRLLTAVGEAPKQYPGEESGEFGSLLVDEDLQPLAEELERACEDCFGDLGEAEHSCGDCGDQELPEAVIPIESLDHCVELLTRLAAALHGRPQQLDALDELCEAVLLEWIGTVFDTLADCGRAADALRLHDEPRASVGAKLDGWIPDRHFLLLDAGKKEEALAEAEKLLCEHPRSMDVQESALAFFQRLGDSARVASIQARIAERTSEALRQKIAAMPPLPPPSVRRDPPPPKPGRNDPCPCGSGKKYKKCCDGQLATEPEPVSLWRSESP